MKLKLIPHNKIVSFEDDLSIGNISDVNNQELRENNPKLLFNLNLLEDRKLVKHRDIIIWYANNPRFFSKVSKKCSDLCLGCCEIFRTYIKDDTNKKWCKGKK